MDSKLLRRELLTVTVFAALFAASFPVDVLMFPAEAARNETTPITIVGGIFAILGHAIWISMDRRRRGKEVGAWRFLAILLPPLAVVLYLIVEYRVRALVFIPLYLGILGGSAICGALAAVLLSGLRA